MTWYPKSYVEKVNMTNMNMRPNPAKGYLGQTYRFYTGKTVYTFGDGLSYSNFNPHLVKATKHISLPLKGEPVCAASSSCKSIDVVEVNCKNLGFEIHISVQNLGKMSGSHTVLLFSSPPPVHNSPQKHLVSFEKVFLAPKEHGLVKFNVDICKDLSVVDEAGNRKVALGLYVLHIGSLKHALTLNI